MFGNTGYNNNNERNINTKIKSFFGEISCLQLSYWNENISIKINPLQGVNSEGIRQYDYNRRANTALRCDKCLALKSKIDEKILPEIQKVKESGTLEKPVNTGISVGDKGSAVFVEYKADDNGVPHVYLTVYTNIGADNKAPKDGIYSYKFAKVNMIDDYDPENGTGVENYVDAEFLFFYDKLKSVADVCGNAAHSVNTDKAYKPSDGNSQNGKFSNYNNGNNNNDSTSGSYSAPVSSFNDDGFPF